MVSKRFFFLCIIAIVCWWILFFLMQDQLLKEYNQMESVRISDSHGKVIIQKPNNNGYFSTYVESVPQNFSKLLIQKEDRFFYYHLGFNPWSMIRASYRKLTGGNTAGSTITQQLSKILLHHEKKRTVLYKMIETLYAVSLELFHSKETLLTMYANAVYFGNNIQGLQEASEAYFATDPSLLSETQIFQLLATLSSPSRNNPLSVYNIPEAKRIAIRLGYSFTTPQPLKTLQKSFKTDSAFELASLGIDCEKNCTLTLDLDMTQKIRGIMDFWITKFFNKNVKNSAVIVLGFPDNDILALLGSSDPSSSLYGNQINMALRPRPIGSTIKPFIYLKGFEKGLRPYSLVEDREYKYEIGDGYAFYPKNYDYQYHGIVSLHYALANSLNVPTVKVLEYVGLESFYSFLEQDLSFVPIQPLERYQLGIALGGLEMSLLELAHYFTIFAQAGDLKGLLLSKEDTLLNIALPLNVGASKNVRIADEKYIQLVNAILHDRETGIEQFGMKSNLNLFQDNYALKTGTSREFHDSWIVGYTPDFLVAVWMGNADNTPIDGISGQMGAGNIWHDVMELLLHSEYNRKTPFRNLSFDFQDDVVLEHRDLLLDQDLILSPHDGDSVLVSGNIPLQSREEVYWYINGAFFKRGLEVIWHPDLAGSYSIEAKNGNKTDRISLILLSP